MKLKSVPLDDRAMQRTLVRVSHEIDDNDSVKIYEL